MAVTIGILAYGSLIHEPGPELGLLIADRYQTKTSFSVEFARKSKTRGWGPTLIPYSEGAQVSATVLVLAEGVPVETAEDMLYRRETRQKPPTPYPRLDPRNGPNDVTILHDGPAGAVGVLLYVGLPSNVQPDPPELARLAIDSVAAKREAEDGITYLIKAKAAGILTPIMPLYEGEILRQARAADLSTALEFASKHRPGAGSLGGR